MRLTYATGIALLLWSGPDAAARQTSLWEEMLEAKAPTELRLHHQMLDGYARGNDSGAQRRLDALRKDVRQ